MNIPQSSAITFAALLGSAAGSDDWTQEALEEVPKEANEMPPRGFQETPKDVPRAPEEDAIRYQKFDNAARYQT